MARVVPAPRCLRAARLGSAELGTPLAATVDVDDEATLGGLPAHRLDEDELLPVVPRRVGTGRPTDTELKVQMDSMLFGMAAATVADAAGCALVSGDQRVHISGHWRSASRDAAPRRCGRLRCAKRVHLLWCGAACYGLREWMGTRSHVFSVSPHSRRLQTVHCRGVRGALELVYTSVHTL